MTDASPSPAPGDNPLLADWTTPFRAPPFGAIRPEHFAPAFDTALANVLGLGDVGVYAVQIAIFIVGLVVMASFVRNAMRVEPFVARD